MSGSTIAPLTKKERLAIASLKRLAKRWPDTLELFSWSGSLRVLRAVPMSATVDEFIEARERQGMQDRTVADIDGIPNDGGDP